MKRTDNILNRLLYLVAAAGLLVFALSCQREDLGPVGETCTLTYKVELPMEFDTKAAAAYEGDVKQLIYEVHYKKGEEYIKLYQQDASIQDGSVELPIELVRDQDYMVLFWAQVPNSGVYNTADLTAVAFSGDAYTDVNAGDFEAFFGSDHVTDGNISENGGNMGLTRAVSQLNIATKNLNGKTVSAMTVTVKGISKTFNVMTGNCGAVDPDASVSYTPATIPTGNVNLFSNFIGFTPINATTRVNVSFSIETEGITDNHDVAGVPVKPNYKSNIIGDFTTDNPGSGVAGEIEATYVKTWEELKEAINKGNEYIKLTSEITYDGNKNYSIDTNPVTIDLDNHTFTSSHNLNISVSTTIKNGTLNCNVNALNNKITFSNVVFGEKLYYKTGDMSANGCNFQSTVEIDYPSDNKTKINFTDCSFSQEPSINLSSNYQFSNLTFSGTKNLSTLTIKTNRTIANISDTDKTFLKSLITTNSFNTIQCICTDGEIEIK